MHDSPAETDVAPIEVRDSVPVLLLWLTLLVAVTVLLTMLGGAAGFVLGSFYVGFCLLRLLVRPVRLRIDGEGIVDGNFWFSPGRIRWDEIVQVKRDRFGLIAVELRDENAFLERIPPLHQVALFKQQLFGFGPTTFRPIFLAGSRHRLLEAMEAGMDDWALRSVRQEKALSPPADGERLSDPPSLPTY